MAQAQAERSAATSEAERRSALFRSAEQSLQAISARLKDAIVANAPAAAPDPRSRADDWSLHLGQASIGMDVCKPVNVEQFGQWPPPFDVVAHASVGVTIPRDSYDYEGRLHSLWYCDAEQDGAYRWYELGFMYGVFQRQQFVHFPAAMDPSPDTGHSIGRGMGTIELARPLAAIDQGEQEAFVERWLGWLAQAVAGQLRRPSSMPETVAGAPALRAR
jgi:serine/threonine-protein kinase